MKHQVRISKKKEKRLNGNKKVLALSVNDDGKISNLFKKFIQVPISYHTKINPAQLKSIMQYKIKIKQKLEDNTDKYLFSEWVRIFRAIESLIKLLVGL